MGNPKPKNAPQTPNLSNIIPEQEGAPFVYKEAEMSLLGTVIRHPELHSLISFIAEEDFYYPRHAKIWRILNELIYSHKSISPSVFASLLAKRFPREGFTASSIEELIRASDPKNILQVALLVKEGRNRRFLYSSLRNALYSLEEGEDPEKVSVELSQLPQRLYSWEETHPLERAAQKAVAFVKGGRLLSTGISKLDTLLGGGILRGGLTVVGARPGVGKTSLARKIARHLIGQGKRIYWLALDQSWSQLISLEAALLIGVPFHEILSSPDQEKITAFAKAVDEIAESHKDRLFPDEDSSSIEALNYRLRAFHYHKPIDVLIVDYLQLVRVEGEGRLSDIERVSRVSRTLKHLARELDIAVLALAQLSRDVERRGTPPVLADLRDSGQVEQDADTILFLHRPKLAGAGGPEMEQDKVKVILAKQKVGPQGETLLDWASEFAEYEP